MREDTLLSDARLTDFWAEADPGTVATLLGRKDVSDSAKRKMPAQARGTTESPL